MREMTISEALHLRRERERHHHDEAYSSYAEDHFRKPAVAAFRRHLIGRILSRTAAGKASRIISLGCGIGDTELMLAPHVEWILGIDLSIEGIRVARRTAAEKKIQNVTFEAVSWEQLERYEAEFDVVLSVFFLHHLSDGELLLLPAMIQRLLKPGGVFYALEPSARRFSGAVGRLVVPNLMKKYQTPDERPLCADALSRRFQQNGAHVRTEWYDFLSTPLAGLLPDWPALYRFSRLADNIWTKIPLVRAMSSNFELIAAPRAGKSHR